MNFGRWILVAFVFFACFMTVLVFVCVREDVGLVSKNYYSEELEHQHKMDLAKNASQLITTPKITVEGNVLKVSFQGVGKIENGELLFLRPSDSSMDQKFEITSENEQIFQLLENRKGLYRAGLKWRMGDKDYYLEKLIDR